MYQFREVTERYTEHEDVMSVLPVDALFLYQENKCIEELIPQYRTLYTDGRGEGKKNITSASTSGDGSFMLSSRFSSKTYNVVAQLNTTTSKELNEALVKLNNLLNKEQLKFTFHDDRDFYYLGKAYIDKVDSSTLQPKVSIQISCETPFKYANNTEKWYVDQPVDKDLGLTWFETEGYLPYKLHWSYPLDSDVVREGVEFYIDRNGKETGKRIKILKYDEHRESNSAELYMNDRESSGRLVINNYWNDRFLDIKSNVSDFVFKQGDKLKTTSVDATDIYVEFRKVAIG